MKIIFNLFLLGFLSFNSALAEQQNSRIIKQNSDSAFYKIEGIPYSIRFSKKSKCNFTEREIRLLQETSQALPETYLSIKDNFYIEKSCQLSTKTDSSPNSKVHLASSQSGRITLTDRVFSSIQDGKTLQLNETFSKKIIAHELTHQLDRKMGYSRSEDFRQINAWERSFGFLKADPSKAEGFQREQGTDNPKEDLATQAEGFFFDADYLCKHPQSYVWFYYWIGPPKVVANECPEEMNTPIDPNKVTDVGYMLISPSEEMAESNFGHALIRFHMDPKNPFDDYVIEAAGNVSGMPALSGFETPAELVKKQEIAQKMQISRMNFLWQGATGQLELKVHPLRYKIKWLETLIMQGRDISERILALTRLQTRVMVYMINRDVKNYKDNYNILTKNCASYVARMINKAFGDSIAQENVYGIFTPMNIYESVSPVVLKDMPVAEGNKSRLARMLPARAKTLSQLKGMKGFRSLDFASLEDTAKAPRRTVAALNKLLEISKANVAQLSEEMKKSIQSLVYSYTVEQSLYLQQESIKVYKQIFTLFLPKPAGQGENSGLKIP